MSESNDEMKAYWNGVAGEKWVRLESRLDAGLEPFSDALFTASALEPGESVLDVGCGCGATTLEAARRVGAGGRALGVDISRPMVERATERARVLARTGARFECLDAQLDELGGKSFDVVLSRFGVMFFSDPEAAFRNLRRSMRPGGRLAFVCWQKLDRNPWMLLPTLAAMKHVTIQRPADPNAPGPFAFSDGERVSGILRAAGFRDVEAEVLELPLAVGGGGLDDAVDFMMEMGPAAQALSEADTRVRAQVREAIREVMTHHLEAGEVRMPSAAWLFRARPEA